MTFMIMVLHEPSPALMTRLINEQDFFTQLHLDLISKDFLRTGYATKFEVDRLVMDVDVSLGWNPQWRYLKRMSFDIGYSHTYSKGITLIE